MTDECLFGFEIDAVADGDFTDLTVAASDGTRRSYRIAGADQGHYTAFYDEVARDYGTGRIAIPVPPPSPEDIRTNPARECAPAKRASR